MKVEGMQVKDLLIQLIKESTSNPPGIRRELSVGKELIELLVSRAYGGYGVPHGNNEPILLAPGFLAGDWSLSVLKGWLNKIKYDANTAGVLSNVMSTDQMLDILARKLNELNEKTNQKVTGIGHSRGGMLMKLLGDRYPDKMDHVITLGSPLSWPFGINPEFTPALLPVAIMQILSKGHGEARKEIKHLARLIAEPEVPLTSIRADKDGIVKPTSCIRSDAKNIEVHGSHCGLLVNKEVYAHLGSLLREIKAPKLIVA